MTLYDMVLSGKVWYDAIRHDMIRYVFVSKFHSLPIPKVDKGLSCECLGLASCSHCTV